MTRPLPSHSILVATACAILSLGACSSSPAEHPSPWLTLGNTPEEQSSALLTTVLDPALPGCSAAVAREGSVVWADAVGSGDLQSGSALTTSTKFDLASNSKHITGMAILLLVHDGDIDLDAPVAMYLPQAGPWAASTTVEQLLHHTSGLPEYVNLLEQEGLDIADPASQAQAMATVADASTPPAPLPWAYSNTNYTALADIVEAVSGQPFAEFVRQRLFAPEDSALVIDPLAAYPEIAARYHDRDAAARALTVGWDVVGDGGAIGTPTDLAEWIDVMRTGLPDDPMIADAMLAGAVDVPDSPGTTYGAGLFIAPDGFVWHTGDWEGHASYLGMSADRSTSVAIACNFDQADAEFPTILQGLTAIWYAPSE